MLYFNRFTRDLEIVKVGPGDKLYGEKVRQDDTGSLYIQDKLQRRLYNLDQYTLKILVTSGFITESEAETIWRNREKVGFRLERPAQSDLPS